MRSDPPYVQPHQASPLVDRQHRVIEVLRMAWPRAVGAVALADELAVSQRSIQRDVARLRAAGVPIDASRGPGGGYTLAATDPPGPLGFTGGELAALVVAMINVGPTGSATAASALDKLIEALTAHTHDEETTAP